MTTEAVTWRHISSSPRNPNMPLGKRSYSMYRPSSAYKSQKRQRTTTTAYIPRAGRGYLRTGGYYGRFRGRRALAGGETKFFDTDIASSNIPAATGAIIGSLNLIPQGVTESTRVGRKCTIKKIHMKLAINSSPTTTNPSRMRVIVFIDKQANGANIAAATDILETVSTNSFRNLANIGRFRILMDKTKTFNLRINAASTSSMGLVHTINKSWNVDLPIEFSSTTGAITEIRSNNIGILYLTETAAGDTQDAVGTVRVRFSDS